MCGIIIQLELSDEPHVLFIPGPISGPAASTPPALGLVRLNREQVSSAKWFIVTDRCE